MKRSCQRQMPGFGLARPTHDLDRADVVRRQKHDPCPPDVLLRRVPIADNRLEATPLRWLRAMEIPVRMRQTRMRPEPWESLLGFKCQIWSTRSEKVPSTLFKIAQTPLLIKGHPAHPKAIVRVRAESY
jgi:hypothetical protein